MTFDRFLRVYWKWFEKSIDKYYLILFILCVLSNYIFSYKMKLFLLGPPHKRIRQNSGGFVICGRVQMTNFDELDKFWQIWQILSDVDEFWRILTYRRILTNLTNFDEFGQILTDYDEFWRTLMNFDKLW